MTEETVFEESSGNVFADLGLENAEELFTRGKIGIQVLRLLKQRNLKQREISDLLVFLKRLDTEITLHLRSRHGGNQAGETVVSL
jgi:hypothetical protein